MQIELENCAADISFDADSMMLTISHADSSGVVGELGLYLSRDDICALHALFETVEQQLLEDEDDDAEEDFLDSEEE
jgi:hypothetical protein